MTKRRCSICGLESNEELLEHGALVTNLITSKVVKCEGEMEAINDVVKRDCNQYYLCLTDIDWKSTHCKNCHQYKQDKSSEFYRRKNNEMEV